MAFPVLGALIARVVAGSAVRAGVASAAEGLAARVATKKLGQETLAKVAQGAVKPKGMPVSVLEDTKLTNARAMTRALSGGVKDSVQRAVTQPATAAGGGGSGKPPRSTSAGGQWPNMGGKSPQPGGNQPSQPQSNASSGHTSKDFSSLATKGNNFSRLLSGQASPQQITEEDEAENRKRADQEATEATKGLVKSVMLTASTMGLAAPAIGFASKKFANSLVDANAYLQKFNGRIGMAYAMLRRGDIIRARQSANATEGTSSALAEAVNQMRDDLRPLSDAATNIYNIVGIALAQLVGNTARTVSTLIGIKEGLPGWMGGGKNKIVRGDWDQLFDDLARGHGKRRRPPIKP